MLSQDKIVNKTHNYRLSEVISHRAWVEVDLQALADNVKAFKNLLSPTTKLMAVIKADAYGHGAVRVVDTILASGGDSLAIATLGEGIELREAGVSVPILILGAINTPSEIEASVHWNLEPTLCTPQQAVIFSQTLASLGQTLPIHLKLDTGMSRLGTSWQEARDFVNLVQQLPHLKIISVYSHLATADDVDSTFMKIQQQRFDEAISALKSQGFITNCLHLANSAGTLMDSSLHYDLVRVGLSIYGLYPAPHLRPKLPLKPVLQVKARITQIKRILAGTGVSYGHKFIAPQDMTIAVVGIGYADGVPRNLSNRLKVLIRGKLVCQIGAITMDQIMLDVTDFEDLQLGEVVTLIGKDNGLEISADDWAEQLNTISWEILCGFKHRLPRISIQ